MKGPARGLAGVLTRRLSSIVQPWRPFKEMRHRRRRGLDPFADLQNLFTRLPSMTNWRVKDLMPEAWARSQPVFKTASINCAWHDA